jgi:2-amino-4-hydroxy-6-hydroxymethyldihydropteridine diphosphokinase
MSNVLSNGLSTVSLAMAPVTSVVAVALGSNQSNDLGEPQAILGWAIEALARLPQTQLTAQSRWYRTVAVGPPQPDYCNGCVLLETELPPHVLLDQMLGLESQMGRVRLERWGPRTLDLDLLFYGDWIIETPTLQVPHPRMTDRGFVLVPLAEVAPDWVHPELGETIAQLAQRVDRSGVVLIPEGI